MEADYHTGYMGETKIPAPWTTTPFADYTLAQWALYFVASYGGIDGAHHKQWVLDQVARILNDAPVTVKEAHWDTGESEYRVSVGTSKEFRKWVREVCRGEDGPNTYDYDEGIAP